MGRKRLGKGNKLEVRERGIRDGIVEGGLVQVGRKGGKPRGKGRSIQSTAWIPRGEGGIISSHRKL